MLKIFIALCLAAPAAPLFCQEAVPPAAEVLPSTAVAAAPQAAVAASTEPAKPELAGGKQKTLARAARVRTTLKKYGEAAALWSELLALRPDYYPAYAERAYALHMDGEKKKAAADFEKAFAADPEQPRAYLLRGAAACASGDFAAASADLARALELDAKLKRSVLYGKTRDSVRFKKKCR